MVSVDDPHPFPSGFTEELSWELEVAAIVSIATPSSTLPPPRIEQIILMKLCYFGLLVAASAAPALTTEAPCDIFAEGGTPCVAAHSTVRALYAKYDGDLYQVQRASDESVFNVNTLHPGGFADAASQDTFCDSTSCVIQRIFDQSPNQNHLDVAPPGGAHPAKDTPANASADALSVGGHAVYSAYFEGGMGYRIDNTTGIAKNDEAETIYMVTSGTHYNDRCCFDCEF